MKWSTNYITEEKRGNGETARMKWHIIVHIYTCRLMYHMMCNYNQFIYFYFSLFKLYLYQFIERSNSWVINHVIDVIAIELQYSIYFFFYETHLRSTIQSYNQKEIKTHMNMESKCFTYFKKLMYSCFA